MEDKPQVTLVLPSGLVHGQKPYKVEADSNRKGPEEAFVKGWASLIVFKPRPVALLSEATGLFSAGSLTVSLSLLVPGLAFGLLSLWLLLGLGGLLVAQARPGLRGHLAGKALIALLGAALTLHNLPYEPVTFAGAQKPPTQGQP